MTHVPAKHFGNRWAAWAASTAVAAIVLSIILNLIFTAVPDALRLFIGGVFAVSGVSALVFAATSLRAGERNRANWFALAVGVASALLVVAEFTVLE